MREEKQHSKKKSKLLSTQLHVPVATYWQEEPLPEVAWAVSSPTAPSLSLHQLTDSHHHGREEQGTYTASWGHATDNRKGQEEGILHAMSYKGEVLG